MTTTLIDCRWLGYSGVGRFTQTLLDGLQELDPPGDWLLWGQLERDPWPGARYLTEGASPVARFGHAAALRLPSADRYLFPHLVRPLVPHRPAVVVAHDTLPVRFAKFAVRRVTQRAYYAASAHLASAVVAYSDATVENLQRDLKLSRDRVAKVPLAVDLGFIKLVRSHQARTDRPTSPYLLYVGLDRPQKNIERAVWAFSNSRFRDRGGRFVLAGVQTSGIERLSNALRQAGVPNVDIHGRCPDDFLADLYARASAVIVPSLEEGYGLPVVEALAAGVPICCSNRSGMLEAAHGIAELFDPYDVGDIASTIDRTIQMGANGEWADRVMRFDREVRLPEPVDMARAIVEVLDTLST